MHLTQVTGKHIMLINIIHLVMISTFLEHCVSGRSELLCLGGTGQFGTSVSKYDGNGRTAAFARDCLLTAYQRFRKEARAKGLECSHARVGRCYCTVDYPKNGETRGLLKTSRKAAFYHALDRMAEATEQFSSLAAETYEGNLYITYLCTTAKSLHSKTKLSEQVLADTKTKVSKRLLGNFSVML